MRAFAFKAHVDLSRVGLGGLARAEAVLWVLCVEQRQRRGFPDGRVARLDDGREEEDGDHEVKRERTAQPPVVDLDALLSVPCCAVEFHARGSVFEAAGVAFVA